MRSSTQRPLRVLVTRTRVPMGKVRCAAVSLCLLKRSPEAVALPCQSSPYHVAKPVSTRSAGAGSGTSEAVSSASPSAMFVAVSALAIGVGAGSVSSVSLVAGVGAGCTGRAGRGRCGFAETPGRATRDRVGALAAQLTNSIARTVMSPRPSTISCIQDRAACRLFPTLRYAAICRWGHHRAACVHFRRGLDPARRASTA